MLAGWLIAPVAWLASPLLVAGVICLLCKRAKTAAALGALAALTGLTAWWSVEAADLLLGAYLWQASLTSFALAALPLCLDSPRREPAAEPWRMPRAQRRGENVTEG